MTRLPHTSGSLLEGGNIDYQIADPDTKNEVGVSLKAAHISTVSPKPPQFLKFSFKDNLLSLPQYIIPKNCVLPSNNILT